MASYCMLKEAHSARAALSKQIQEKYKNNHTFDDTEEVTTNESIFAKKFEICRSISVKSHPLSSERTHNKSGDLARENHKRKRK